MGMAAARDRRLFVLPSLATNYLFEGKPFLVTAINGGYHVVRFALDGVGDRPACLGGGAGRRQKAKGKRQKAKAKGELRASSNATRRWRAAFANGRDPGYQILVQDARVSPRFLEALLEPCSIRCSSACELRCVTSAKPARISSRSTATGDASSCATFSLQQRQAFFASSVGIAIAIAKSVPCAPEERQR